uniref:Protein FAM169B n=1 Tax=Salvator merianae TaxID=96440 RepID=A0A8D0EB62_SALMN
MMAAASASATSSQQHPHAESTASACGGQVYPVDVAEGNPEALEAPAQLSHAKLLTEQSSAPEFFCVPGREKIKLETSLMCFLPLYGKNNRHKLLVLMDPQNKNTVLAAYLHGSWWSVEDILKTADPSRDGLKQVQTFEERIVLFTLNCIIFGRLERRLTRDVLFVPHSEKEHAKIFWRNGEATAFYTMKMKGSMCNEHSGETYLLPVLDTMFVRKKFRRCGLGMKMLQDFCQTFAAEDDLGLSTPVSADMYRVCQRFLESNPREQSRLWEVEAPGDWSQRINIWLKIQLEQKCLKQADGSSHMEKIQDDEPGQSVEGQMHKSVDHILKCRITPEEPAELKDGELIAQHQAEVQQYKGIRKRARTEAAAEDAFPKNSRVIS